MAIAFNDKIQYWSGRLSHGPVGAFVQWWTGELKRVLPSAWRERLQHSQRRLAIVLDPGQLRLGIESNRSITWIETLTRGADVGLQRPHIRALVEKHDVGQAPRFLLLDEGKVLRKHLSFPAAAESNLKQVLAFEMDRQTPFRANEVYYTSRLLEPVGESGQFQVELIVVPRKLVDASLEQLLSGGLPVSGVDVLSQGETLGVNLLPPERRHRVLNPRSRMNYGLAGAAVVLLVLAMWQSLNLRANRVEMLEEAIAEVQDEARRVQALREQIGETAEAASFLTRRRATTPMAIEVIADLTKTLPDDTYLDRLVINQESVLLQGKSRNSQQLIELVNQSEILENAAFRGSTRLDAATGLEIFEVNAELSARGNP